MSDSIIDDAVTQGVCEHQRNVYLAVAARTEAEDRYTHAHLSADGCGSTKLLTDANSEFKYAPTELWAAAAGQFSYLCRSVLQGYLVATLLYPNPRSSVSIRNSAYRSEALLWLPEESIHYNWGEKKSTALETHHNSCPRSFLAAVPHDNASILCLAAEQYLEMNAESYLPCSSETARSESAHR